MSVKRPWINSAEQFDALAKLVGLAIFMGWLLLVSKCS
jgi:hypothetical protein